MLLSKRRTKIRNEINDQIIYLLFRYLVRRFVTMFTLSCEFIVTVRIRIRVGIDLVSDCAHVYLHYFRLSLSHCLIIIGIIISPPAPAWFSIRYTPTYSHVKSVET